MLKSLTTRKQAFWVRCMFDVKYHFSFIQCCGSEIIIFGSGSSFGFNSGSGLLDKSYKTLPNLSLRKHRSKILQPLQKIIIEHRSSRFYNLIFLHQLKFELQII
jgi:hypothetical protein